VCMEHVLGRYGGKLLMLTFAIDFAAKSLQSYYIDSSGVVSRRCFSGTHVIDFITPVIFKSIVNI